MRNCALAWDYSYSIWTRRIIQDWSSPCSITSWTCSSMIRDKRKSQKCASLHNKTASFSIKILALHNSCEPLKRDQVQKVTHRWQLVKMKNHTQLWQWLLKAPICSQTTIVLPSNRFKRGIRIPYSQSKKWTSWIWFRMRRQLYRSLHRSEEVQDGEICHVRDSSNFLIKKLSRTDLHPQKRSINPTSLKLSIWTHFSSNKRKFWRVSSPMLALDCSKMSPPRNQCSYTSSLSLWGLKRATVNSSVPTQ